MLLPLHMGSLHPYEQALTLLLAFGPFVLLGIVVAVRRRSEAGVAPGTDEETTTPDESEPSQPAR